MSLPPPLPQSASPESAVPPPPPPPPPLPPLPSLESPVGSVLDVVSPLPQSTSLAPPAPTAQPDGAPFANGDALPPPLPYYDERQMPPRRKMSVLWSLTALVIVAVTLAVIFRAMVTLGPAPAAAIAPARPGGRPPASVIAPDPLASAGVGASVRPAETFDRATAAVRAAQERATGPTRRWAASGAFNLSAVKSAQDLDRRMEVLDALVKATREARLAGEAAMQQLRGELSAAGVASVVQQELWVAQWAAEVKLDPERQVALAVEKFLGAGRVQLRFLRENWGRWYLDRATDRVRFDDALLQTRFDRQAAFVGSAEADLNEALRKAKATAAQ